MSHTITVATSSSSEDQCQLASEALRSQRQRFRALLRDIPGDGWSMQSRCREWSVHDVLRHLCDTTLKATSLLHGARPQDVDAENMDPRIAPVRWLARSANERPGETLTVFEDATADLLAEVDSRAGTTDGDVQWVYGPVTWSIAALHVFWDAWVHERDILIPLGRPQAASAMESRAAAIYGLLMAGLPRLAVGGSLEETIVLTGEGGGVFLVEVRHEPGSGRQLRMAGYPAEGSITVTVDEGDDAGAGGDEPLHGQLVDVVDSLVGRQPELSEALVGPSERLQALNMLRVFMLLPVS
ncbi:MAG: maleylpyruvate isomerase family mycothiol-dependent enzyme [Acidimicrobiales bacterium]